ncbi:hypothetical protein HDA36_003204 [Nocardiopsis composta]|uniref:Uncharacterized protein n=1 Tax=Nocardiopsis composta TaxID=157465 RepID=A0A7W8VEH7_9ACTN|nr:hypothetical protein [Nocardiopsis composta]
MTAVSNRSGGAGGSSPRSGRHRIAHMEQRGCPFDHAASTVWGGSK